MSSLESFFRRQQEPDPEKSKELLARTKTLKEILDVNLAGKPLTISSQELAAEFAQRMEKTPRYIWDSYAATTEKFAHSQEAAVTIVKAFVEIHRRPAALFIRWTNCLQENMLFAATFNETAAFSWMQAQIAFTNVSPSTAALESIERVANIMRFYGKNPEPLALYLTAMSRASLDEKSTDLCLDFAHRLSGHIIREWNIDGLLRDGAALIDKNRPTLTLEIKTALNGLTVPFNESHESHPILRTLSSSSEPHVVDFLARLFPIDNKPLVWSPSEIATIETIFGKTYSESTRKLFLTTCDSYLSAGKPIQGIFPLFDSFGALGLLVPGKIQSIIDLLNRGIAIDLFPAPQMLTEGSFEVLERLTNTMELLWDRKWGNKSHTPLITDLIFLVQFFTERPDEVWKFDRLELALERKQVTDTHSFQMLMVNMCAESAILSLVKDENPHLSDQARLLLRTYRIDSPPWPEITGSTHSYNNLETEIIDRRQQPELSEILDQIHQVFSNIYRISYGFAGFTFEAKRFHPEHPSLLVQFGRECAERCACLNCDDINTFPGPGVLLSGIKLESLFVADTKAEESQQNPYQKYLEAWPWAKDALRLLPQATIVFTRGFIAIWNETDEALKLNGTSYGYIVFNEHFHNVGASAYLIPVSLLKKLIEPAAIDSFSYEKFDRSHPSINSLFPLGPALLNLCTRSKLLALDIGSPSAFGGGFSKSLPRGYGALWNWENGAKFLGADRWGHSHFWFMPQLHMHQSYENAVSVLRPHVRAHHSLFRLVSSLQHTLSLAFVGQSLWHKGQTSQVEDDGPSQPLSPNFTPDENPEWGQRMLRAAYEFHSRKAATKFPHVENFPILCCCPIHEIDSPARWAFKLDTWDMSFSWAFQGTVRTIAFPTELDRGDAPEKLLWAKFAIPFIRAARSSGDLRFLDRAWVAEKPWDLPHV